MQLSARNQLEGNVTGVEVGQVTAKVVIEIDAGTQISAIISKEAAEELQLREGDTATAVIKATEVMVMK